MKKARKHESHGFIKRMRERDKLFTDFIKLKCLEY